MKKLFFGLLIFFCAINCHAAMHYDKPTPRLCSILDSPERANNNIQKDGWADRMNESVPNRDEVRQYRSMKKPPGVYRTKGITFMIVGGAFLLAGGALWLYADAETQRQRANGGRSYTGIYYTGALMLGCAAVVFAVMGFLFWVTHLRG